MAATKGPQAKDWCFTLFPIEGEPTKAYRHGTEGGDNTHKIVKWHLANPGEGMTVRVPQSLVNFYMCVVKLWDQKAFHYIVFQSEICPKTQRTHLQGFIQFRNRKCQATIKRLLETERISLRKRNGTPQEASDYCEKSEDSLSHYPCLKIGEIQNPDQTVGKRNDIKKARDAIINGDAKNMYELMCNFEAPFRHYKAFKDFYAMAMSRKKRAPPKIIILWGDAGTGKTTWAKSLFEEDYCVVPAPAHNSRAWIPTDYDNNTTLIFDEFSGWVTFNQWKQLCTKAARVQIENKGGHTTITSEYIIFTSNEDPRTWWKWDDRTPAPMAERVDLVLRFARPTPSAPYYNTVVTDETRAFRSWCRQDRPGMNPAYRPPQAISLLPDETQVRNFYEENREVLLERLVESNTSQVPEMLRPPAFPIPVSEAVNAARSELPQPVRLETDEVLPPSPETVTTQEDEEVQFHLSLPLEHQWDHEIVESD
jgi:hypothetical protein